MKFSICVYSYEIKVNYRLENKFSMTSRKYSFLFFNLFQINRKPRYYWRRFKSNYLSKLELFGEMIITFYDHM